MTEAAPVLSVRGLRKIWRGPDRSFTLEIEALDLRAGEVTALSGPSGSGKSTLLELLGLASRPDAAARFMLGGAAPADVATPADVAALHAADDATALSALRAERIGYVVQTGALLPFLTIAENAALPAALAGRPDPSHAAALLDALELAPLRDAYPAALSVGQRQRAALARALAGRPALLLADEPTAALDPALKETATALICDMAARIGAAVLIATHEAERLGARAARHLRLAVDAAAGGARARLEPAS